MITLGIETTCDETACALLKDGKELLSHTLASQMQLHRRFGGVVPELAARQHVTTLPQLLESCFKEAKIEKEEVDLIAVAKGPGLIGALLVGLNAAKALSLGLNRPLVGVNHVEAHLYASMMQVRAASFPALGLVVSGGHTFLLLIKELSSYELIGTTVDDAAGEAFDKVASLLGLPYPGGPEIEKLAKKGDPSRFLLKAGSVKGSPYAFSFSGIKTNVQYLLKGQNSEKNAPSQLSESEKADLAASFQKAVVDDLIQKAKSAYDQFGCKALFLGGGVCSNSYFREKFLEFAGNRPLFWPPAGLSGDNAVMIAALGTQNYLKRGADSLALSAEPRIPF